MDSSQNVSSGAARRPRRSWWRGALAALAVAGAASLSGCAGAVGAEAGLVYGHPVAYAEVTPVGLEAYPRVYYRGSYAYLIDGAWYYPTARGWVVFRDEPVELRRYRTTYVPSRPYYRTPEYGYPRERPRRYRPR